MLEDNNIITESLEVANIFNDYFVNITRSLPILPWTTDSFSKQDSLTLDPIEAILYKFKNHPSVARICREKKIDDMFSFSHIEPLETFQVIMSLNQKKSTSGPISAKILKIAANVICVPLTDCFNAALHNGIFPDELKLADVVPVLKKGDTTSKVNYRPISILPALSKVFERILFKSNVKFL